MDTIRSTWMFSKSSTRNQSKDSLVTGLADTAANWSLFISVPVSLSFPVSTCNFLSQNLSWIYCSKPRYEPVHSSSPKNSNPCISSLPTINSMQDDISSVIKPPNQLRPHYIIIVKIFSHIQDAYLGKERLSAWFIYEISVSLQILFHGSLAYLANSWKYKLSFAHPVFTVFLHPVWLKT